MARDWHGCTEIYTLELPKIQEVKAPGNPVLSLPALRRDCTCSLSRAPSHETRLVIFWWWKPAKNCGEESWRKVSLDSPEGFPSRNREVAPTTQRWLRKSPWPWLSVCKGNLAYLTFWAVGKEVNLLCSKDLLCDSFGMDQRKWFKTRER